MRLSGHQISKPIMKTDFIFSWKQSKREAEDKSVRVTHFAFPFIARMWARQCGRARGMSIFFRSECHSQITRCLHPRYVTLNTYYEFNEMKPRWIKTTMFCGLVSGCLILMQPYGIKLKIKSLPCINSKITFTRDIPLSQDRVWRLSNADIIHLSVLYYTIRILWVEIAQSV